LGSGKKAGKRPAKDDAKREPKLARRADARPAWDELEARTREAEARLTALQRQLDDVLAALGDSTARLHDTVAAIDDLPTSATTNEAALELRRRLEQMLVAQQRTNELLDLALGVALESGESPQQLRWHPARARDASD
jgi:DNA repair exonuclease SbcCD ATPase subunit